MEITVNRRPSAKGATIGELSINGVFQCFTLEDMVREIKGQPVASWKIPKETAIPCGRFGVTLHDSPHFGCILPMLVDVPGYGYVLIHWGNAAKDTDGCILVGLTTEANLVYHSRDAFNFIFPKIQTAIKAGEAVYITVN